MLRVNVILYLLLTLCFLFMLFSIIFYLYCFFKCEWIFYRSWFNTTIMYYSKPCSFFYQLRDVQVFSDHHQLLDSGLCDVVVVSSPNMTHFGILMDIINHQKPHHVLVEKPLCTTVEDCKKVARDLFNDFAILHLATLLSKINSRQFLALLWKLLCGYNSSCAFFSAAFSSSIQ